MNTKTKRSLVKVAGLIIAGLLFVLPNIFCHTSSFGFECNNPVFNILGFTSVFSYILGPFAVIPFLIIGWLVGGLIASMIFKQNDGKAEIVLNRRHSNWALILIIIVVILAVLGLRAYLKTTSSITNSVRSGY